MIPTVLHNSHSCHLFHKKTVLYALNIIDVIDNISHKIWGMIIGLNSIEVIPIYMSRTFLHLGINAKLINHGNYFKPTHKVFLVSIPHAKSLALLSRQLTVHWQPTMIKLHRDSSFTPPESQNCHVGYLTILIPNELQSRNGHVIAIHMAQHDWKSGSIF